MSSRTPAGKQKKKKKCHVSTPEKPAATVVTFFKKQLQQQQQQQQARTTIKTDNGDEESDDGTVVFVKEEQRSVYFSSQESQSTSQENDVVDGEKTGCSEESYSRKKTRGISAKSSVTEAPRRLSRRLSLKKAHDDTRKSVDETKRFEGTGFAVSHRGDGSEVNGPGRECEEYSSPSAKSIHSISEPADCIAISESVSRDTGCRAKPGGPSSVLPDQRVRGKSTDEKTAVGAITVTNSSSRGKLSLKRKQTSPDSLPKIRSPKLARSDRRTDTRENSIVRVLPAVSESTDRSSAAPVFSIFRQSSLQGKASKSSASLTDLSSVADDSRESPSSVHRNAEKPGQERKKITRSKGSSETRRAAKRKSSPPSSSTADAEATQTKETENKEEDAEDKKEEIVYYRVPYYLENFNTVMTSVFADDYYVQLFSEEDLCCLEEFKNLTEPSQKLYVRLFSRKLAWLSTTKIKYPEIADDLAPCLQELVRAKLVSSGEDLEDLTAILAAMSAPDLRTLAKSYHVNPMGQQKGQIIQTLVAKSQQSTVASHFGQKIGGVKVAMLKRAKKVLGGVYQLCKMARAVFVRAMMLFSLINTNAEDETGSGGQGQLFQMLLVNMGRVVYPAYTVDRQTRIFRCRQDLIRFEEALQLEAELLGFTTTGNWKRAYSSFLTVKDAYDTLAKDSAILEWDSRLPEFLRYYTAGSVLVRLLNQGIEILQRRKEYLAAVTLIRDLLGQSVYNLDLHGYWRDRLALNLDVHLKQPGEALQAIQDGLDDPVVRTGHRLSLFLRAEAICSKPKSPYSQRLKSLNHEPLAELPKAFVDGRVLPHTLPGSRYQFITSTGAEGDDEVAMCNVEQVVLDHYRVNGFPQGIHAEGSVVSTLFCLYFWEVMFLEVPDAFHSPYQSTPLDLHTDAFYQRRQEDIDARLTAIENADEETLHSMLATTWEKQNGVMCAGINWDRFSSVTEVQGLVSCMGGRVLSGILRRYAKQPRHTRSGFPDLTLWNTGTKKLKISEVKGPGDRLSHKQMMWLDYLLRLGVDAEVCHVKPVGVKKLKPLSKQQVDPVD